MKKVLGSPVSHFSFNLFLSFFIISYLCFSVFPVFWFFVVSRFWSFYVPLPC